MYQHRHTDHNVDEDWFNVRFGKKSTQELAYFNISNHRPMRGVSSSAWADDSDKTLCIPC